MDNNKKPSEPLEAERREKVKPEIYIQERSVYLEYQGIRHTLMAIQIVQVIQGAALFFIALTLLLK